ncbi:MAG: MBL fold metallo-hydrolase [Planctomycetota bacterium]|jgi:hypothetical protein
MASVAVSLTGCGDADTLTKDVRLLPRAGGNLVLFHPSNGRLLVDTRTSRAGALRERALRFVVECHPQGQGDRSLPAGTVRVSHRKAAVEETAGTGVAFRSTLDLSLGKSKIHCYHKGAAFTDADCLVYLPDDQVLIVGNLVQPGRHAVVDTEGRTNLRSWARVLRDLHKDFHDSERLQVVPAHGKPGPAQLLLDQADYLEQVLDFAAAAHRHGLTLAEMLADVDRLIQQLTGREGKPNKALLELAYQTAKG